MSDKHLIQRLRTELVAKQKIKGKKGGKYNRDQLVMLAGIVFGLVFILIGVANEFIFMEFVVVGWILLISLYIINTMMGDPGQEPQLLHEIANHKEKINNLENKIIEKKRINAIKAKAKIREMAHDYDAAIQIWEGLGEITEAARVRKLKAELGAVKVTQKVVQGDEITKTKIKDSVVSKSNIGSRGDDKVAKLEKIGNMKKEGLITDEEYEKMKKEIIG